jgi:DNA topoisomerase-1
MNKYTLIITEKPDAALRIATALDEKERPQKMYDSGVPYYIANRDRKIVVVPALGHLYTITGEQKGRGYPIFNYKWVPRNLAERKAARIRTWVQTIANLAKDADVFIDACDYDVEGCIIGYFILKYACDDKEQVSKRMKFSTLTKQEIENSYERPLPHLDFGLVEAGRTRHEVDWLYGINLSRALMTATTNASGKHTILSTGRVQGPTLKFLVEREEAIGTFVPIPYWKVKAFVEIGGQVFEAKYEKEQIGNKKEAEAIVSACRDKNGQVEEISVREFLQPPPFPFNLGTLQNEAYSLFRYSPRRTLGIAQQLYLNALISYPRTDSQKLPASIEYRTIFQNLSRAGEYRKHASELLARQTLRPNEGRKDDPAHPSIYPTGNLPDRTLGTSERKILDLVVRRFMAVFGEPAVKQSMKVTAKVDGHTFNIHGNQVLRDGWMQYYEPYIRFEEIILPPLQKGQTVRLKEVSSEDRFTEPPPRYNPSSLLREMDERGIGTKATRAEIIQTLNDRGYVEGERMSVTSLGFEVFHVLETHCPVVVSTSLTRDLEARMMKIQENKERREEVLAEVTRILKPALEVLKQNERTIGQRLTTALQRASFEERTIGACPVCKSGQLIINYSKKTGKRFVGCTNYFKGVCRTSFPLPQKGIVKPTGKRCPMCGWPTVEARIRRRPWLLCFNTGCPSKTRSGQK